MAFDFKQDIQEYMGQQGVGADIGSSSTPLGKTDQSIGDSPTGSTFNFQEDIKQYEKLQNAPATEAIAVENVKIARANNQAMEAANKRKQMEVEAMKVNPNDDVAQHQYLSPDELIPTANIEIDYANEDLTSVPIATVPDGTVGGHCGVFAENIVKLPDGGNWIVGDTIQQKTQSIERYKKAGLAFKQGEDVPRVGNTIIQNPGTKWGHVAVINSIDENGVATLTESNWNWDKKVTNTRKIRLDDPSIVGFIKTQ